MPITNKGGGKYEITPAGDNPKKINTITLTLDANSVGKFEPVEAALPGGIPSRYPDTPNGDKIHWLTNFKFNNLGQEKNPSFTLELPRFKGSTYVYYNEETKKLAPLGDPMTEDGGTVTYNRILSDPSVGMT